MQIRVPGPIPADLTVIETMCGTASGAIAHWPLHLARLGRNCAAVGFALDEDAVGRALAALRFTDVSRVRLTVDAAGRVEASCHPLPRNPQVWKVVLSDQRLGSEDPWLRIKTSHRPVYDAARAAMPATNPAHSTRPIAHSLTFIWPQRVFHFMPFVTSGTSPRMPTLSITTSPGHSWIWCTSAAN